MMSSIVRVLHCKFLGYFFSPKQVIQVLYALLSKAVYQHLAVCCMYASPNSLSDVTMKGAKAVDYYIKFYAMIINTNVYFTYMQIPQYYGNFCKLYFIELILNFKIFSFYFSLS